MAYETGNICYVVKSTGELTEISGPWDEFYSGNCTHALCVAKVLGRNVFDCLADNTTRYVYENFHQSLLNKRVDVIKFESRCDSSNLSRLTEIQLKLIQNTELIQYESRIIKVRFMRDEKVQSNRFHHEFIQMCSICKSFRTSMNNRWMPLDENFSIMQQPTEIQYSVCPNCLQTFSDQGFID